MNKLSSPNSRVRILNYICAALALVLIATQFIPFWGCYQCKTCGEGKIISIFQYVWFANDHKSGLTSVLQDYYIPGFKAMDVVGTSVLILLTSTASIVLCLTKPKKLTSTLAPLAAGLCCVIGYLTQPAYQMGQLWFLHLAVGIVLIIASTTIYIIAFCSAYKKAKADIAAEAALEN